MYGTLANTKEKNVVENAESAMQIISMMSLSAPGTTHHIAKTSPSL
jgi:hypothetical protein